MGLPIWPTTRGLVSHDGLTSWTISSRQAGRIYDIDPNNSSSKFEYMAGIAIGVADWLVGLGINADIGVMGEQFRDWILERDSVFSKADSPEIHRSL